MVNIMNRKILIIVENLPVPFDTRVWNEATTLVSKGYTVSVICPMGKGYTSDKEVIDSVNVFRYPLPKEGNSAIGYFKEYFYSLWNEYKLAKVVYKEIGFDVIQGCNPPDNIFLIALAFKKYGVDYVFDHHDICPELYEAKFNKTSGILYQGLKLLERLTYKTCVFSFATNESYKEIAITRGKMDPNKVYVLRSGPKFERMIQKEPIKELKRGYKYMVGYLGVIGQQEGLEYILECAKYNKEHENDIIWAIVGGGPHLENIKNTAHKMNLDDCIIFTGRVDDNTMLNYLNTADVCVNSDVYNSMNDKSTMNKILEYMALGKPIVQFDLKEGRYSAQSASLYAKNNDYLDMTSKIRKLLDNPKLRKQMGDFGYNRIKNEIGWEHTSKVMLDAYDKYFVEKHK